MNLKTLRAVRWVQVTGLLLSVVYLLSDLLRGYPEYAAIGAVLIVIWSLMLCLQAKFIARRAELDRPHPDYAAIARMEREVWGETFEHEGAPPRIVRTPTIDHRPERLPEGYVRCPRGHRYYRADYDERPRCFECEEERHDRNHPDATEPATVDQYAAWLRGYIKRGGKPTHYYDYPFSNARFRYASTRLTIDSGYEFGARSRMIVVASGASTQRTNPSGPFGGWGHTKVFFMHGHRANDIVPVYSDPEFDFAR